MFMYIAVIVVIAIIVIVYGRCSLVFSAWVILEIILILKTF